MRRSELIKILKKNGCYFLRDATNHEIWHSDINDKNFILWRHAGKEIPSGTLNKILKDAGIK